MRSTKVNQTFFNLICLNIKYFVGLDIKITINIVKSLENIFFLQFKIWKSKSLKLR